MSEQKKSKPVKLEIHLDEETAQGAYANLTAVHHSESEFVLDFLFVQPQAPRAKVRSRIVTSPRQAKRLLATLNENLRRYEETFGPIAPEGTGPGPQPEADHYH